MSIADRSVQTSWVVDRSDTYAVQAGQDFQGGPTDPPEAVDHHRRHHTTSHVVSGHVPHNIKHFIPLYCGIAGNDLDGDAPHGRLAEQAQVPRLDLCGSREGERNVDRERIPGDEQRGRVVEGLSLERPL